MEFPGGALLFLEAARSIPWAATPRSARAYPGVPHRRDAQRATRRAALPVQRSPGVPDGAMPSFAHSKLGLLQPPLHQSECVDLNRRDAAPDGLFFAGGHRTGRPAEQLLNLGRAETRPECEQQCDSPADV